VAEEKVLVILVRIRGRPMIRLRFDPRCGRVRFAVKRLYGAYQRDVNGTRVWHAAFCEANVNTIDAWPFQKRTGRVYKCKARRFLGQGNATPPRIRERPAIVPTKRVTGLRLRLRRYQRVGVAFLKATGGRCLLADDMGLGKTPQVLAWIQLTKPTEPVVVVCPATVKIHWSREVVKWTTGYRPHVINGVVPPKEFALQDWSHTVLIINYDILSSWWKTLRKVAPGAVVFDECHKLKNRGIKRSKAAYHLAKKVQSVIGLSGTPVPNRPYEFWNVMRLIDPALFPNFNAYARRFCDARHNGFKWDYSGASHTEELNTILTKTLMLRRTKTEVLTELPDKERIVEAVPLEKLAKREYMHAERDFSDWLERSGSGTKSNALTRLNTLKQLAVKAKLLACLEWIADLLETAGKVVVFCHHRTTVKAVEATFRSRCVSVYGGVSQKKRQEAIDKFQTDKRTSVFVGTLAAVEGIDLTAASVVVMLELWWTPSDHEQAEDRVYRMNQKADAVQVYYLIAAETVEEDVMGMLDDKRDVVSQVVDGKAAAEEAMLTTLLKRYRMRTGAQTV